MVRCSDRRIEGRRGGVRERKEGIKRCTCKDSGCGEMQQWKNEAKKDGEEEYGKERR